MWISCVINNFWSDDNVVGLICKYYWDNTARRCFFFFERKMFWVRSVGFKVDVRALISNFFKRNNCCFIVLVLSRNSIRRLLWTKVEPINVARKYFVSSWGERRRKTVLPAPWLCKKEIYACTVKYGTHVCLNPIWVFQKKIVLIALVDLVWRLF